MRSLDFFGDWPLDMVDGGGCGRLADVDVAGIEAGFSSVDL